MDASSPADVGPPPVDGRGTAARHDRRRPTTPAVSVIVPTYDEADNIEVLLDRLEAVLADHDHEIIVVDDDSPDGTWEVAEARAARSSRIRVLRRRNERGLSSAVLLGMTIARGEVLVVIDADLQHDERAIPALVSAVADDGYDICLGSREVEGGDYGDWGSGRRFVSWAGATLARTLLRLPVTDPMSGFFAVSRARFELVSGRINPRGFKILLEFVARGPRPTVQEVGYRFGRRVSGSTKLTGSVVVAYLLALIDLTAGRFVSATFTAYALVGSLGLLVRAAALLVLEELGVGWAAAVALEMSILFNFFSNNAFTFSSLAHRGRRLVRPLLLFHLISGQGVLVQMGVTTWLGDRASLRDASLVELDAAVTFLAGVLAATIGNYFLNINLTWRPAGPARPSAVSGASR